MPRKRAASSADLTGGTGDYNPQWVNQQITCPATGGGDGQDFIELPISRLPTSEGRAIIIEILRVQWDVDLQINPVLTGFWNAKSIAYLMSAPIPPAQVTAGTTDLTGLKTAGTTLDYAEKTYVGVGSSTANRCVSLTSW